MAEYETAVSVPRRALRRSLLAVAAAAMTAALGLPLASPASAAPPGCPCSLWTAGDVPSVVDSGDTAAVELGLRFSVDVDAPVTGLRFYKSVANVGTHVGSLWTADGVLLARVTFSGESASGWQSASFDAPVQATAGVVYVVSYHAPNGGYSFDPGYFAAGGREVGILNAPGGSGVANGVFTYSAVPTFPTGTFNGNNYWVDPIVGTAPAPTVTGLSILGAPGSALVGDSGQLTAVASYSDGSTADVTSLAAWSSSASGTVSVSAGGAYAAVAAGTATVQASFGGLTATATVTVTAPVTLTALAILGAPTSTPKGTTTALAARATYSDGTVVDVTNQVAWSSSAPGVVSVNAAGSITAAATGTATIRATFGGRTASVNVTVTAAVLRSLAVTPGSVRLFPIGSAQLKAVATYSDGTTKDVTSRSRWTSSNLLVASVSNPILGFGGGRVSALLFGTAVVRASYTEGSTTVVGSSNITVAF